MVKPILRLNIKKVEQNLLRHLERRMNEVVTRLVTFVKNSMTVSNLGGANPSSPGEAPHIGTAALKRSITFEVTVLNNEVIGTYGTQMGPSSNYARRLELGFVGRDSKGRLHSQAPRPFIRPAYSLNKRKIRRILRG